MIEENKSKKVLLSVLAVAILIVAVVGISFAAFVLTSYTGTNTIQTGTLTISYTEPASGLHVSNALPMSDTAGKAINEAGHTFPFTVSTNASGVLTIPYEINITKVPTEAPEVQLLDSQVKVYLSLGDNTTQVVAPALISSLTGSTLRPGSKIVHTTSDAHTGTGIATNTSYILKMWIDGAVVIGTDTLGGEIDIDSDTYEYRLLVNVDSSVPNLS